MLFISTLYEPVSVYQRSPNDNDSYIMHYGVPGQHWNTHQFGNWERHAKYAHGQPNPATNPKYAGISKEELALRLKGYSGDKEVNELKNMSDDELRAKMNRMRMESDYINLLRQNQAINNEYRRMFYKEGVASKAAKGAKVAALRTGGLLTRRLMESALGVENTAALLDGRIIYKRDGYDAKKAYNEGIERMMVEDRLDKARNSSSRIKEKVKEEEKVKHKREEYAQKYYEKFGEYEDALQRGTREGQLEEAYKSGKNKAYRTHEEDHIEDYKARLKETYKLAKLYDKTMDKYNKLVAENSDYDKDGMFYKTIKKTNPDGTTKDVRYKLNNSMSSQLYTPKDYRGGTKNKNNNNNNNKKRS